MFDYLVVGAELYGATAARILADMGRKVLIIREAQSRCRKLL
jgi:UDP-galactopyranose mutase